jgi:hypothetical protein
MKTIIRQILLVLTLIAIIHESQCQFDQGKIRLSRVFEDIVENNNRKYDKDLDNEISRAFNMDCVKTLLNLPQNNKVIVTEVEEMILMVAAGMQCSDEDKVFETQLNQYAHSGTKERLTCGMWKLQQLEPTSKLVENFEISEAEQEECKVKFPTKEIEELQQNLERVLGPLNVYTCGAVSDNGANDLMKFVSKSAAIRYGNISEELRKSEKEALKNYFKDVSTKTTNCIIQRYLDNPEASYINDTLNYFYEKELIPIDPNRKDYYGYHKRLAKVKGTIDYDCVKEKLNLPENGDKILLEVEAFILIASAKSKCIRVDLPEFSELFIDYAVDNRQRYDAHFFCAREKLEKLEPTSKLVVMTSYDKSEESDCDYRSILIHAFHDGSYKLAVGRFNETSCGVLTDDIVKVIIYKTTLLASVKDKELKSSETKDLFNYATGKLHNLADCILDRIK